jgi:hypothetical protein
MILRHVLALLVLLPLAAPAGATDLCFDDDGQDYPVFVFKKVKLPTKPNDARPLTGIGVTGTAYTNDVGSLGFVVTTSSHCIVTVGFDDQLVGTASVACMNGMDSVKTWRPVACP